LGTRVDGVRIAILVGLMAIAPLTGCLTDLQRADLSTSWDADARLAEAPSFREHGAPAMLSVDGAFNVQGADTVTITGFEANVTDGNRTIAMDAMRVDTDDGTLRAGNASGSLELGSGDRIQVTFVPGDDQLRRADPRVSWDTHVELLWRYDAGDKFDAGRTTVNATVGPERASGLGVGVAERSDGAVDELVFEAVDRRDDGFVPGDEPAAWLVEYAG